METSRIRFSFKSKNQAPLFMMVKEYYENGETTFAKCLVTIWDRKTARKFGCDRLIYIWTKHRRRYGYPKKISLF